METNPPRNSRSGTHRDDGSGRGASRFAPHSGTNPAHRIERFPHASENSSHDSRETGLFEHALLVLDRRQIPQRRVQTFLVVDAIEKLPDAPFRLGEIFILEQIDLFIFQGLHERFRHGVVVGIGLAAHADANAVLLEQLRVVARGVLHAAGGVMHQAQPDLACPQGRP